MFCELYVEFFARLIIKFARRLGTRDWRSFNATVTSSELKRSWTGCLLVVIRCRYRNADKRFEKTFKQPFVNSNYAEAYLRRYPGGSDLPVLVRPNDPSSFIPAEGIIEFTRVA
jgi:hypothetical protein